MFCVFSASSSSNVLVLTQEKVLEGVLEGGVAEGVAGGVDRAVDVAEPVANGPKGVWDADGAEGVDQDHHVVRRPRGHEGHEDGHDGARHFPLSGGVAFPLPLCNHTFTHSALCYLMMKQEKRSGSVIFLR